MKLGLITDIHEQAESLDRVLARLHALNCDEIACLGDIAGHDSVLYHSSGARSASACVQLIRTNCRWVVGGNHDREVATESQDLSDEEREYLMQLPDKLIISPSRSKVLLSHYLYPDLSGSTMTFLRRLNQLEDLFDFLTREKISLAMAGHAHPPGVGFAYPSPKAWTNKFRRAFHYMPYQRYELDGDLMACLLPALASRSGRPGFSVWETENKTLDIMQITLK